MTKKLIKKHDQLSKKFLTNLPTAQEFVKIYLDQKILAKCDIKTLSIESGSYIDEKLQTRFSDVVYKIDFKNKSNCAYVYVLVEHQSSPEELMPVRILRYQLEIIQKHIDTYEVTNKLPLVVPLIIYNGTDSPYPYETDIINLFGSELSITDIGLGRFKLIDLTTMTEDEILKHKQLAVLEMCLKHIRARDFLKVTQHLLNAIIVAHKNNFEESLFNSMLSYLTNAKEYKDLSPLFKNIEENISEYKETVMTYAEELRQEGMRKGIEQGIEQGREEGMRRQLEMIRKLIKSGVDESIILETFEITKKELDKIKRELKLDTMH